MWVPQSILQRTTHVSCHEYAGTQKAHDFVNQGGTADYLIRP